MRNAIVEFSGHGTADAAYGGFLQAGDFAFSFVLPATVWPGTYTSNGFPVWDVQGTFTQNGSAETVSSTLDFRFLYPGCGGFTLESGSTQFADACGPQMFTGSGPFTFTPGAYTDFSIGNTGYRQQPQTTIADVTISSVSTTPEPTSIVLLGTGLAGLVPIVRRRRK